MTARTQAQAAKLKQPCDTLQRLRAQTQDRIISGTNRSPAGRAAESLGTDKKKPAEAG